MEIRITIQDQPIKSGWSPHFQNPAMPKISHNPYYVLEIQEADPNILNKIKSLFPAIEKQFTEGEGYLLELTPNGFSLKKKVERGADGKEAWEKWEEFSNSLYREVAKAVGVTVPDPLYP